MGHDGNNLVKSRQWLQVSKGIRSHTVCLAVWMFVFAMFSWNPASLPAQEKKTEAASEKLSDADREFFEKHVRPLLEARCLECHSSKETSGGLRLDAREHVLAGGDTGAAVIPGDPSKSLLMEAVRYSNRELQMPPKSKLSEAEIEILQQWIARGLPDPRKSDEMNEGNQAAKPVRGMSPEDGRQFWSIKPLGKPAIPDVENTDWVRNPIDSFILASLEKQGMRPAPQADKRTLLRRVTYDLIGLPPTVQELNDFLADNSPEAFQRVIERLLQSPQYGVRWGRHWLDVARYADSNGLDENLAFGHAWRYRDYVIDSFQRDKPYDRFISEQIAGDLLPDANDETKTATGFLVLGGKVLAEPDRDKLVMDTIDEQIDTLGKAFMGLALGCARCHDHKFDPILQTDYYALAAIFKSTKTFADSRTGAIKHWHETSFETAEDKEKLKPIDADIAAKQKAAASYKATAIGKIREQAREQATAYLLAALLINVEDPLPEIEKIAKPLGLHPRILLNCRRHLAFHRDDPFFSVWHAWSQHARNEKKSVNEKNSGNEKNSVNEKPIEAPSKTVMAHYEPLFMAARQWDATKRKDSKATPPSQEVLDAHAALMDTSGFLTVPAKAAHALDDETLAEYNRLANEARLAESFAPDHPGAMTVSDGDVVQSLPIHIRGSHRNLGAPVERTFPQVFQTNDSETIWPRYQSGRLELARWLTTTNHALVARVQVNRVWGWHLVRGLCVRQRTLVC